MKQQSVMKSTSHDRPMVEKNIGFTKVGSDTLRLEFGEACFELHTDGTINFYNGQATLTLMNSGVEIKCQDSKISLQAGGEVLLNGKNIKQVARGDVQLEAGGEVLLNSF
jgi:hypothetical protein